MFSDMLAGLSYFDWSVVGALFIGVLAAQIVVIIPGLGGHFVLVMMLPLLYGLEPLAAITLICAASVTTGTGNTITSVLFGIPGSNTGIATTFDGFPMAQRGEASRAIAAGLMASLVGGILGALMLAALLPVVRPLVLSLGSPEFFILIFGALLFMSYLGEADTIKSLIAGGFGLMLSMVGQEPSSGALRYTFDQLWLYDGIGLIPLFVGLYAIAEMMALMVKRSSVADVDASAVRLQGGTSKGIRDVFREWPTTLQSSATGMFVGIIPGLGQSVSQFVAYLGVQRTSKDPESFGKGNVKGVIAADAATNATDAGAMIPTLGFGIPGSSTGAILLAGLITIGLQPGPEMLTNDLDVVWMIVWILVFANIIATLASMGAARYMARLTFLPEGLIVPAVLAVGFFAAYSDRGQLADVWMMLAFGVLGFTMMRNNYSRATMIIGFILGSILERHYLLTMRMHGMDFLRRPVVIGLLLSFTVLLLLPQLRRLLSKGADVSELDQTK